MLSLRVSRDKRGYDYIYLLLEARRRGRVENRLLYCGRWPAPCRVGLRPFDNETRARLEQAHPDVAFDWPALLKTLNAALGVSRPSLSTPAPPQSRARRPAGAGAGAAYAHGGRPGGSQSRRPGMAPSSRRDVEQPAEIEPIEPGETLEDTIEELVESSESAERDYIPGEVVLVSAEIEERESTYTAPELEPVCEADRQFAAGLDLELVTEEIVHIPVATATAPETPTLPTGGQLFADPTGGQLFAEASGPAVFHVDPDTPDPGSAPGGGLAAEVAGDAKGRPHRHRRRRGGRGRGKQRDFRQGSD